MQVRPFTVALAALGLLAVGCGGSGGGLLGLSVGDCFDGPGFDQGYGVDAGDLATVDCDEPHDNELYVLTELDDGDWSEDISNPLFDQCNDAWEGYVGASYDDAETLDFGMIYPDQAAWDAGERAAGCYLHAFPPGEGPLTGSVEGSGG